MSDDVLKGQAPLNGPSAAEEGPQIDSRAFQKLIELGIALSSETDGDRLLENILLGMKELTNADGGTTVYRKEGPTGVIFTTTEAKLHPEDETRIISMWIDGGAEENRAVLAAQATEVGKGNRREPVVAPWLALHDWIKGGPKLVTIPFAVDLSELVDSTEDRIKRDFPQLLSLIRAHARLHQANRRIEDGKIVAEPQDYGAVLRLLGDALEMAVGAQVPPQIATVVEMVTSAAGRPGLSEGVPLYVVAEKLSGDASKGKSLASKWVNRTLAQGYLVNDSRPGHPMKLLPGEPIPGERRILPTLEELLAAIQKHDDAAE
jgi:hypothetical protein